MLQVHTSIKQFSSPSYSLDIDWLYLGNIQSWGYIQSKHPSMGRVALYRVDIQMVTIDVCAHSHTAHILVTCS